MKKLLICLMLTSSAWAQDNITLWPLNTRTTWTVLDSGSTVTHDFIWSTNISRHNYYGFCTVYAWTDTTTAASQTIASYDSLYGAAYALKWDPVSGQYEKGTALLYVSGKDSINVADWIAWGTGHSDNTYTVSKVLNIQNSDGVRIVWEAKSDMIIRDEVQFTQGN